MTDFTNFRLVRLAGGRSKEQKLFVGSSGKRIKSVMTDIGLEYEHIFWMNTVPFKPIGNKKWPMGVVRKCYPFLLDLLANWQGNDVITFGVQALEWFGMSSPENRRSIALFQKRADKFTSQLQVVLSINGVERSFILHPVPHPSGLNRAWSSQFDHLLKARLQRTHA
ncbi:uracil-DNA glycosylase family protein [Hydrogenophaga sp.]|uniref:uracil-DNA glycosylase family protein n=1 Tax=Hydrogenophaga sp. TaxID=1904254 RepID=UPI002723D971|nr:uracil-DNA glycosylase family protein [Hydrogenophaga sp.]MDO8905425.1 uracil-DNA glycosylase family protein [Hydrogenophaga sp.]